MHLKLTLLYGTIAFCRASVTRISAPDRNMLLHQDMAAERKQLEAKIHGDKDKVGFELFLYMLECYFVSVILTISVINLVKRFTIIHQAYSEINFTTHDEWCVSIIVYLMVNWDLNDTLTQVSNAGFPLLSI